MESQQSLYRSTRVIWYLFAILEVLLAFRFALKLLGANAGAGFTSFIYSLSSIPLSPFRFVFKTGAVGGSVFEWSTLLAMAVYWVIALGIIKLIVINRPINEGEAKRGLEIQDTTP